MKRRWLIKVVIIVAASIALWASTMLIAYTDRAYICENTGSRKGYREWVFGIKSHEWYHESGLESFIATGQPKALRHRWTSYRGTGRSLLPVLKSYGHGRPSLIVTPTSEMFDEYVQSLSSEQRLELYYILCSADYQRVREVVDRIADTHQK